MQPKPKPESLDDLLVNAEHYANFSMRNMGRMPPTLFLIGANGSFMFIPDNLADEHAKDDFATTARLMCITHAANLLTAPGIICERHSAEALAIGRKPNRRR